MAAARQGLPVRLDRAPQRGAAFAAANASRRVRTRSIGSRSRASGSSVFGGHRTKRKLLRWSVGHRRAQQGRVVTSPGPSLPAAGRGAWVMRKKKNPPREGVGNETGVCGRDAGGKPPPLSPLPPPTLALFPI